MKELLAEILDAHGGMKCWNEYYKVEATIVSGGDLFQLKGIPQDPARRRMSDMHTPWDPLHRAYFNGEALWTYLTTPFLLAMGGVKVEETEPWREGGETRRVVRAYFPLRGHRSKSRSLLC